MRMLLRSKLKIKLTWFEKAEHTLLFFRAEVLKYSLYLSCSFASAASDNLCVCVCVYVKYIHTHILHHTYTLVSSH